MSFEQEFDDEEIRDMDEKEFRKSFPSGWMELTRYETLVLVVDALLESNPAREFTTEEVASVAGTSTRSVEEHIGSLIRLGMVEELEDRDPERYTLNEKSPITQQIYELNKTVEQVKNEEISKSLDRSDKVPIDAQNSNSFEGSIEGTDGDIEPDELAASMPAS